VFKNGKLDGHLAAKLAKTVRNWDGGGWAAQTRGSRGRDVDIYKHGNWITVVSFYDEYVTVQRYGNNQVTLRYADPGLFKKITRVIVDLWCRKYNEAY